MTLGFLYPQIDSFATLNDGTLVVGVYGSGVARWTGSAWELIPGTPGGGDGNYIRRLAVLANGDLVVAGVFHPSQHVRRWDGQSWTSLGSTSSLIYDMIAHPNGNLYTGGAMSGAGSVQVNAIAGWNATSGWFALGSGLDVSGPGSGSVFDLAVAPNGDLVVNGNFDRAGGQPANNYARWTGSSWTPIQPGGTPGFDMIIHPSGEMLVGGNFFQQPGVTSVGFARYTFTNIPWVARHPQPFTTSPGLPVTLSATAATGYDNLTFQWQRETTPGTWTNLTDGPGGASPNGGTVSGSTGTVNGGEPALLSISGLALSDAGNYRCIISNPCGQDESDPALLTITNPCPPDITTTAIPGNPGYLTPNGTLNNDDFFAYLIEFIAGNLTIADLTTTAVQGAPGYGVPNGVITNDDFFYYLILFSAGC